MFASIEGVESVLRNGPWMIRGIPIFLNKWSPSVSLLKEELLYVPVLVKFHDLPLVAYTSDELSLITTKIGNLMMLDTYTNSMCLESWGRSSYARILIEINAFNDFCDHLVMVVPNFKGNGYTKETIRIEYEWDPPHCSTCLIFGHSPADFPKAAPIRVVNQKDKGKGQTSGDDDKGNTFSLSNSFEALNDDNLIIEEVATDKINVLEKHIPEGKRMIMDDDGKPLEKVEYPFNLGSDDKVEPVENEIASFLTSKPTSVGYGLKSLLEQWRKSNVDDDYDPYDDDMYEGQEISDNIQTICDNLNIKVRGRKKK
ncbi:RNA-directed DNA polymerase, eukaryota, reverse transcriptase zinc-binding domain protein [Tanacetum coccineum]